MSTNRLYHGLSLDLKLKLMNTLKDLLYFKSKIHKYGVKWHTTLKVIKIMNKRQHK